MSEPSSTPPVYSTPPDLPPYFTPPSKGPSRPVIVGLVLLVVFLLGGIGFGIARLSSSDFAPKPFAEFGKTKVVRELKDGWSVFAFDDLKCEIALPVDPEPDRTASFGSSDFLMREWAMYGVDAEVANLVLSAFTFRVETTPSEMADGYLDSIREDYRDGEVKVESSSTEIAGARGHKQRAEFVMEGQPCVARSFFFKHRGRVVGLQFVYLQSEEAAAEKVVRRVMDSVSLVGSS